MSELRWRLNPELVAARENAPPPTALEVAVMRICDSIVLLAMDNTDMPVKEILAHIERQMKCQYKHVSNLRWE
jgi:hypothetical protein